MKVLLLDGTYSHSLAVAKELKSQLQATILGVGAESTSALLRSRHCDVGLTAPRSSSPNYAAYILSLAQDHRPGLIFPVGFHSHAALLSIRDRLPPGIRTTVTVSHESFEVASNKAATYELAQSIGIEVPLDLTAAYKEAVERRDYNEIPFPVFLKAQHEAGGVTTALVNSVEELESQHARIEGDLGPVLVQEFIDSGPETYAYCGYFESGKPLIAFQHLEVRSVPRHGGSGTRLRTFSDPELAQKAETLLRALRWDGIAQVEFKRRRTGEYVLMEINPKLWASYALAYRAGYPIASTAASRAMSISRPYMDKGKQRNMDMVFPIREAMHVLTHLQEENPLRAAVAMLWPPAAVDFDLRDLPAHLPYRALSRAWSKLRR